MPAMWSAEVRMSPAFTRFEGSVSVAFPLVAVTCVQNVGGTGFKVPGSNSRASRFTAPLCFCTIVTARF